VCEQNSTHRRRLPLTGLAHAADVAAVAVERICLLQRTSGVATVFPPQAHAKVCLACCAGSMLWSASVPRHMQEPTTARLATRSGELLVAHRGTTLHVQIRVMTSARFSSSIQLSSLVSGKPSARLSKNRGQGLSAKRYSSCRSLAHWCTGAGSAFMSLHNARAMSNLFSRVLLGSLIHDSTCKALYGV